jgi:hypothetical protein
MAQLDVFVLNTGKTAAQGISHAFRAVNLFLTNKSALLAWGVSGYFFRHISMIGFME